ncbi:DUF2254 domain-containing protein [Guptibacillus algicola]|uniref:DUF2254 domain-containing protein n=1 Tax=Guptibacillus algicola TaxID=225844 RepID=UPI001CD3289C|nr:DUF2254 domain-containing protein [Alkalihalobacillus algicola]MCA0987573.1 DUF2254 domain-containing protein [Alkalihalobacillus algicola]
MFKKFLPWQLRKYFDMPRRVRKHELQSTLWYMPAIYILGAILFAGVTLFLDLSVDISRFTPELMHASVQPTRLLVSSLIGGILTLSAFTLNSVLVVLTTFSGQFSPRMLLNFVADRTTQHFVGIFHGSFVYVLVTFLLLTSQSQENFVVIPAVTFALAFITVMTFILFINHATSWMQVHNIATNMKDESISIVRTSLSDELEEFRSEKPVHYDKDERENETEAFALESGYIQLIDFRKMIKEAKKDNIMIQYHKKVGDYVLRGTSLFSFWGSGAKDVDVNKYHELLEIGYKETEIQDIKMGMTKLSEIGVKSLGNNDPKTAITIIHQMADLLLEVEKDITFTPYLADKEGQVRVVMESENFGYYLYRGYGYIRHYAGENYLIISEIILALSLVSQSISKDKLKEVWEFGKNTMDHIDEKLIYDLDRDYLLEKLYSLAYYTGHEEEFHKIEKRFGQSGDEGHKMEN